MKEKKWYMTCGECGEQIIWSSTDYDDDDFSGVIDKLTHHINYDKDCVRERKLKILFGTKEKLAQDYWYHGIKNKIEDQE